MLQYMLRYFIVDYTGSQITRLKLYTYVIDTKKITKKERDKDGHKVTCY